ncbi:DNA topoisomerase I [Legionella birminghamensis]|uniref:DNA topoisomerase n=2 Tax=Legionella TaxID=445 RepID=A0A378JSC6_9GAMM|nr:DNA topoisomerase 3 [Legionella birminghamensis]KTC71797.1 DNA topoisomerase I [Legionella birminghamensis]STX60847.1 DNA topoisomerase [Legionella birminghamensis]
MRLFIAEKPSVARAIADELGVTAKEEGYIICGQDKITWCFGHLLELAEPDRYLSEDIPKSSKTGKKLWRAEDLPIIPEQWIIEPKADTKKQLNLIGALLKEATLIINAGDADREGQLLIDEVLRYFNNQKPVQRFWVAAHDAISLQRGLASLKDNQVYFGLGQAALARSQADWLIGMNLSRAYTLNASKNGARALVTVGRVQTPTLKLVVDRDRQITAFQSKPFYTIQAVFSDQGQTFLAEFKPNASQPGLDEDNRLIDLSIANSLVERVSNRPGTVTSYQNEFQVKQHPRAYSLSDLTLEGSNRYGYSAAEVLEVVQALYETHKLTTYPRTDCGYLPESQFNDASTILDILGRVNPELLPLIEKANPSVKSKTWNDKKVTVHFGIIPTMHPGSTEGLTPREKTLYKLIVKRYIAQFYPLHEFESTLINIEVDFLHFIAKGKTIVQNGWLDVYPRISEESELEEEVQRLPLLSEGSPVQCMKASRTDTKTKPPARFTEGTLIRAMENIHQFIADNEHKKMLRDGDGIGTPATRGSILKELKNRGFIEPQGKNIVSTALGQSIVDSLPEMVKSPILTAMFERILKTIEQESAHFTSFMEKQTAFVKEQVHLANQQVIRLQGAKNGAELSLFECHCCHQKLIKRKGKNGYWWACSAYPTCKQTYSDLKGKPQYTLKKETTHA